MSIKEAFNFVAIKPQLTTSGLPTIEQLRGLEAEGYDALINLLPDENEYAVEGESDALAEQSVEYIYIPVDYAVPDANDFAEFKSAMDRLGDKKVHIHCAANYRVSGFYGIYAYQKGEWTRSQAIEHINSLFNPEDYPPWPEFIEQAMSEGPAWPAT